MTWVVIYILLGFAFSAALMAFEELSDNDEPVIYLLAIVLWPLIIYTSLIYRLFKKIRKLWFNG